MIPSRLRDSLAWLFARVGVTPRSPAPSSPPAAAGDGAQQCSPPSEAVRALVAGTNQFALDLLQHVDAGDVAYSPQSIAAALAMVEAGAAGATRQEIREILHDALGEGLHSAFGELLEALRSRQEQEAEGDFRLRVVNGLWAQEGMALEAEFRRVLERDHGTAPRLLDFEVDADAARRTINAHIAEATAEKIPELLSAGMISSLTRLVLTNAVYFKGPWLHPFPEEATDDAPFTTASGVARTVPMMRQTTWLRYESTGEVQALELPYVGEEVSMVVLLPAKGRFDAVAEALSVERLAEIDGLMRSTRVQVGLPRFEVRSPMALRQILSAMGMSTAFGAEADFSRMTVADDEEFFLDDVIHEAFIAVDEAGTEAAAATATMMFQGVPSSSPPPPEIFTADRPFLYFLRDRPTGAILFAGRVVEPLRGDA